jgi:bifunctional DNase/RNase
LKVLSLIIKPLIIALAIKPMVPIYADEEVLAKCGVGFTEHLESCG